MKIMKERWGDNAYLLDNLQQNPLPNSYMVYVNDKASADRVSKEAPEIAGVSDIKYYQDTVEKLSKITRAVEVGSIVMMAFLIVVSVILVANTIKLTVFNRAKEIGIMKYLGATDWFVPVSYTHLAWYPRNSRAEDTMLFYWSRKSDRTVCQPQNPSWRTSKS